MSADDLETLRSQVQALTAQVQELQRKMQPAPARAEPVRSWQPPGRDWTEGMSMPANAKAEVVGAFPEELAKAVRSDRFAQAPTSMVAQADVGPVRLPATGYVRPLKSGYQG